MSWEHAEGKARTGETGLGISGSRVTRLSPHLPRDGHSSSRDYDCD